MRNYLLIILFALGACQDDDYPPLSGRYNFIEPPHPASRLNRGDFSTPAFDVIFTVQVREISNVDLVIDGAQIPDAVGLMEGDDIVFEGGGGTIRIIRPHQFAGTLQAKGAEFTSAGQTKTFGPLQIDRYQ